MHNKPFYRVPDIIDKIYNDVMMGLYSAEVRENRVVIAKCNLACDKLINSAQSENDIAEEVDFPSLKDFRTTFRGFTGISPEEFRRRFSNI